MRTPTARRAVLLGTLGLVLLAAACAEEESDAAVTPSDGAVAAGTPEAAEAGERILARGGNAADAAVAVSLALAVTEPGQSGLGGSAVALVRAPGAPPVILHVPVTTVGGAGDGDGEPVILPALLPVLERLWRRHGSGNVTWEELVEPAAALAEDGFRLGRLSHRTLVQEYPRILADTGMTSLFLTENRAIPAEGTVLTRPALAATLRRIARQGAADLYRGELATRLVAWSDAEARVSLGAADLASPPQIQETAALEGSFGPWTVWTAPEPFAGPLILRALRLLETAPEAVRGAGTDVSAPWTAEALAWAFSGRGEADLATHLSTLPPLPVPAPGPDTTGASGDGETTHFSIMDANGMAVAVTQTLGRPYGSAIPVSDLGFVLGEPGGEGPETVPGSPAGPDQPEGGAAEPDTTSGSPPGPSTRRWMSPALVTRGDSLELLLGSPGGPRGVSAVVQVVAGWVGDPRRLQEAVSAPRIHVGPAPGELRGRVYLEGLVAEPSDSTLYGAPDPWGDTLRVRLTERGFLPTGRDTGLVFEGLSPWFGGVNAVARVEEEWVPAADPRRDGVGRRVGDGSTPSRPVSPGGEGGAPLPPRP